MEEEKVVIESDLQGVNVNAYIKVRQEEARKNPIVESITSKETLFRIGEKGIVLILRPFTIARQEKFFALLGKSVDDVIRAWEKADTSKPKDALLPSLVEMPIDKLVDIINFVFDRTEKRVLPAGWVKNNFDIATLRILADEIIKINKLEKLIPFFVNLLQVSLTVTKAK